MATGNLATVQMIQNILNGTTAPSIAKNADTVDNMHASEFATASQGAKADTAYQKPVSGIPESDMEQSVQGLLDKAGTAYQKPSTGIPKTDLASAVQTSLNKADTALQSAPVTSVNGQVGNVQIDNVASADKVENALTININGVDTTFDGSEPKRVTITSGGGDDPNAVKYIEQSLSDPQKAQARSNIGAQEAGDYATNAALSAKADQTYVNNQLATKQPAGDYPTTTQMNTAISSAIDAVTDGAPAAFDTFKEIADWIASDESGTTALVNRVSAVENNVAALEKEITIVSLSIVMSRWANNAVTLTASDAAGIANVTESSYVEFIVDDSAAEEIVSKGVQLSGQASGSIVFSCVTTPATTISGTLKILNQA